MVSLVDPAAGVLEDPGHQFDIEDRRDVGEMVSSRRQEGRDDLFEDGVLRTVSTDSAGQTRSALDEDLRHHRKSTGRPAKPMVVTAPSGDAGSPVGDPADD